MSIEQDLRKRLRHYGLEKAYDASVVCVAAEKVAEGRFRAISFRRGVLKLAVDSAAAATRLRFEQKSLLEQIEKVSNARITRLIFTIEPDSCNQKY